MACVSSMDPWVHWALMWTPYIRKNGHIGILPNPDKFDQWWTEHELPGSVCLKCHVHGFLTILAGPVQVLYRPLRYGKYWKKSHAGPVYCPYIRASTVECCNLSDRKISVQPYRFYNLMWQQLEQYQDKVLQALHSYLKGKKSYRCYKPYRAHGWVILRH